MWFETIDFNSKQLLENKLTFINILFVCRFHQEEVHQFNASKIPRTFLLT